MDSPRGRCVGHLLSVLEVSVVAGWSSTDHHWAGHVPSPQEALKVDGWIVSRSAEVGSKDRLWRCLLCLASGRGDEGTRLFAVEVHRGECSGDPHVAKLRLDLLTVMSATCWSEREVFWSPGFEDVLLLRGGLWHVLAGQVGWPHGAFGFEGWSSSLDEALEVTGRKMSE